MTSVCEISRNISRVAVQWGICQAEQAVQSRLCQHWCAHQHELRASLHGEVDAAGAAKSDPAAGDQGQTVPGDLAQQVAQAPGLVQV